MTALIHSTATFNQIEADALVIGVYKDSPLSGAAEQFNQASGGVLQTLIDDEEISGKLNQVTTLLAPSGVKAKRVLVVGLGEKDKFDQRAAFRAAAAAAKRLAGKQRKQIAYFLEEQWTEQQAESGVCGALIGCQGQDLYRAEKKHNPPEEILWNGSAAAVESGGVLGESVNLTRRLVNEPANMIYPESFAEQASQAAQACGFSIEIWDQAKLEQEKCGSLLAVARGSTRPPRLLIMEHKGAEGAPLALVGKGVTFDSGGLSLKPSEGMQAMKCDMAGAATVLGAMSAIARLKLPVRVIGLVGLVENMVAGDSYKLGDVLTARSGKTIEVLNTDAEGRLVLADVLNVAVERGAEKIVDLATLTGACLVALGVDTAGLMSNDDEWRDQVQQAAELCGEAAWPLPMFEEFGEQIRSEVADIKNIGAGRWGGTITAAKFLEEFVEGVTWTHIDIAGPAFLDKPKAWIDAGGSGAFVRTLVQLARRRAE